MSSTYLKMKVDMTPFEIKVFKTLNDLEKHTPEGSIKEMKKLNDMVSKHFPQREYLENKTTSKNYFRKFIPYALKNISTKYLESAFKLIDVIYNKI